GGRLRTNRPVLTRVRARSVSPYSSRAAFLERAKFTFNLDQAPMQIFETLIALRGGGVQLLQAEQADNVSEDMLALVAQRIAEHAADIIDRQVGDGAAPDLLQ